MGLSNHDLVPLLRDAAEPDATAMATIYNHYIEHTVVTFEETPVTADQMNQRRQDIQTRLPWLVAESHGQVVGYAYAGPWRARAAYRHTVESAVYLDQKCVGCGIGTVLYRALLSRLNKLPLRVVIGGASLPNPASVALHEKLGFRKTAEFAHVGFKFGRWIDVGFWQLELENRNG